MIGIKSLTISHVSVVSLGWAEVGGGGSFVCCKYFSIYVSLAGDVEKVILLVTWILIELESKLNIIVQVPNAFTRDSILYLARWQH